MGRSPSSSDENGLKKGPWTPEEDQRLIDHIEKHGHGSWRALPKLAGLNRCGKSCRLRWTNYLRPDIKRGKFSEEEEQIIISLHEVLGNKWSAIATRLPGRTDNEIKNFWNTHLRKKLLQMGIDPITHRPRTDHLSLYANLSQLLGNNSWDNALMSTLQTNPTQLAKLQLLQNILQVLSSSSNPSPTMDTLNLLGIAPQLRDNQSRVSEYLRLMNSQLDLAALNPNQLLSSFPVLDVHHHQHQHGYGGLIQPMGDHSQAFGAIDDDLRIENPLPGLVSASPDQSSNVNHQHMESKINTSDITNHPTTFEDNWSGQLVDDEAGESYWRDIIEQATSPNWPLS